MDGPRDVWGSRKILASRLKSFRRNAECTAPASRRQQGAARQNWQFATYKNRLANTPEHKKLKLWWGEITGFVQKPIKVLKLIEALMIFEAVNPVCQAPWCQKPSGWTPFLAGISLLRISIHAQGWSWCPGPWEAGSWTCNPSLVDLPHPCICVIASYGEGLDWSLSIIDICWEIFSWETICSCLESN